ncbi:hypothetical protein D5S17_28860 [Pseudonocardiaceae bacterium YIM PH 21723]|nr:hypothetical protein D5S17_28860 [Pseudonocardiaceae bacterium YIM PH 21723]
MATPPRITRAELRETLVRIINRRVKVDDPDRHHLCDDPDQADPREVRAYLRRYAGPNIPRWVLQADAVDRLTLGAWTWWDDRRDELADLRAGIRLGLFLSTLGAPLGIKSPQGVQDRMDRLEALLKYDRPDEKLTRTARRIQREHDPRDRWVTQHATELQDVAGRVLAAAERHQVTGEWLEELAADHAAAAWSPASLGVLGLALGELRTASAVTELQTTHNVHRAIAAAEHLRTRFAHF